MSKTELRTVSKVDFKSSSSKHYLSSRYSPTSGILKGNANKDLNENRSVGLSISQQPILRTELKIELHRVTYPTKIPTSKTEEDVDRSLQPVVRLNRLRLNEILVTTPSTGLRKIIYTGSEYTTKDGTRKLSEYRCETVSALPRLGDCDERPEKKFAVIHIAAEYPWVFYVGDYKDDIHSVLDVLMEQKMSTMVLDAYLTRRLERHNKTTRRINPNEESPPEFLYLPLLFFPVFSRDQKISTVSPSVTLFPSAYIHDNCILIAPQYVCKHFYLAIFYLSKSEIKICDSSWKFVPDELRINQVMKIADYISNHHPESKGKMMWIITLVKTTAQQMDEDTCGSHVISYVENELNGNFANHSKKLRIKDLNKVKCDIMSEILPTSSVGIKLLDAITM